MTEVKSAIGVARVRGRRRARRRSVLTALGSVALLALSVGVAHAEVPRLVPNGNFASEGGLGVAVDQSSGDVFVTGFVSESKEQFKGGRSEKFDASGKLLSPPSPFAEGLYYGAAVNPTNGDLYLASVFSQEIGTYDPNTGELVSSFPVPPFSGGGFNELFENLSQVATDSAGDVYVPNVPGNEVLEYTPTGTLLTTFMGSGEHTLSGPTGVAVDSSGNVWVADARNNRIEEFASTGAFLSEFRSEGVRALALDAHGNAFAIVVNSADYCGSLRSPCAHLVEYSSTGAQLADVGAGDFGSADTHFQPSMVAVNMASGRVYVTDALKSRVWVFQPPLAPMLGRESAAEVGVFEAKLAALVNPGGAQTAYRFEYDTRQYGEGEAPHGVSVPFPEGSAGEGFSSRTVWASATGLAPGTTYHYRAVLTNGLGTVVGPDQTFTTETAAQAACPNEQSRGGFSGSLPDCRAYELLTPPSKTSFQPDTVSSPTGGVTSSFSGGGFYQNYASNDGNRMAYWSSEVLPGSQSGGFEYVATRRASGWSSEDVIPLQSYTGDRCPAIFGESQVNAYSTDLSKAVLFVNGSVRLDELCRGEIVEVVPGEPLGVQNLLLRDNNTGAYTLIDVTPPGVTPTYVEFVAASADESRVLFVERAKLTPDALNNSPNVYEWSKGVVHLAFVLPSGATVAGSPTGNEEGSGLPVFSTPFAGISANGSDVFFTAGGKLYVRLNGTRTVQLDEARGGSGPGGGGSFGAVTADGSQVFFTADASAGLTADTVPGSGSNLYRYDVGTSRLSDLTPVEHAGAGLAGIGEDGSYVYFSSESVLSGSQTNQFGETAQSGQRNFYLDHAGTITFIMRNGGGEPSANGAYLAFTSETSLTGYDNIDANTGNPDREIYLYSAASNRFACASCNPSGEAPSAGGAFLGGHAGIPHYVSDYGEVFFQTAEALLPSDTNGQTDVYEYHNGGGLHLISSGTSRSGSLLLDASASGSDVFFLGRQALVPQDSGEEANRIYDARVDGGFPETALPPACTTTDACRSAPAPAPSIFGEPSSQTFTGVGNLTPPPPTANTPAKPKPKKCGKGYAKKKGKCVKVKKARKTHRKGRR
jgi:hypothetical protein